MLRDTHAGNVRSLSNGAAHATPTRRAKRKSKKSLKERLYKEGPVNELKTLAARAAFRLRKKIAKAKAYGLPSELRIPEALTAAAVALEDAVRGLNAVPADWTPARGSIGGSAIEEGATVRVKKEHRAKRIEMGDPSAELKVVKVVGGKMVCQVTEGDDRGMRIVVSKMNLEPVTE